MCFGPFFLPFVRGWWLPLSLKRFPLQKITNGGSTTTILTTLCVALLFNQHTPEYIYRCSIQAGIFLRWKFLHAMIRSGSNGPLIFAHCLVYCCKACQLNWYPIEMAKTPKTIAMEHAPTISLFVWLVADGWC
jgi:hypothetical protein